MITCFFKTTISKLPVIVMAKGMPRGSDFWNPRTALPSAKCFVFDPNNVMPPSDVNVG